MTRGLKALLFVGVVACVVKVIKFFTSHDEERPPIRVRSGGSLEVTVCAGDFTDLGDEWKHVHHARGPNRLQVTMTGTDCGTSSFSTHRVTIHCSSSSGVLEPLVIQRRSAGGQSHAFVRPPMGAPRSKPSNTQVLIWPNDSSVVIDSIDVGGTTCLVTNPNTAEVFIAQKR